MKWKQFREIDYKLNSQVLLDLGCAAMSKWRVAIAIIVIMGNDDDKRVEVFTIWTECSL